MKYFILLISSFLLYSCSSYNYQVEKSDIEKNKEDLLKKQEANIKPFDYYEYYRWGKPNELK